MSAGVAGAQGLSRFSVRWLRVVVAVAGLAAMALGDPFAAPLASLALPLGAIVAVLAARRPDTLLPGGVLAAAVVARLAAPDVGVGVRDCAQAAALLGFHLACGLAAAASVADTIEWAAVVPTVRRGAGVVALTAPAAAVAMLGPTAPGWAAAVLAAAVAGGVFALAGGWG